MAHPKVKTIYKIAITAFFVISISGIYFVYSHHHATKQCERAYDNYIDYMNKINAVAIDNGFSDQPTVSLNEFCR